MSPIALPQQTAAVLHGAKDLRIEQRPLWPPQQGQCQVQIVSTGLCGSDLHYYMLGRNGDFAIQAPLVLGHEAAGVITSVGPGVLENHPHLVPGTRVAVECGVMCRECKYCHSGRYNLCKSLRFCSSAKTFPHLDGTLQEKMNHPAHVLHPLPDNLSYDLAALAEPLSVLLHAARRAATLSSHYAQNKTVLVLGVGAIGLLACALAKASGATRVCAVDINQDRLDFAKKEGFAESVYCLPLPSKQPAATANNANKDEALKRAKDNAAIALETFGEPDGFDVVFECTGAEGCILMSVFTALTGGKVTLVGMGTSTITNFPLAAAALREVDLIGSFRYADTYPEALSLLGSISKLVTHKYHLRDAQKAFELVAKGRDAEGKMVLKVVVGTEGEEC
ncbi:GroES-like protein [Dendrothele bispora CBS 962.96]|uniref:GroES-like protein n=1 Tax=Dendrothele bispora (strain CBS 962.96) TaxID=1314807 RepID=A0A4S8KV07_DENBC|nr:GroES-like protein [Dendrothele bispora CBS 962.96]